MSLLAELRDAGAQVVLDGNEIVLRGVPRFLAQRARESKAELLAELRAEETTPPFDGGTSEAVWARTMRRMLRGVIPEIRALVFEEGDPASLALEKCESWLQALEHHDRHGSNWWRKHQDELKPMMRALFPDRISDEEFLEGADLERAIEAAFPGCCRRDRFHALFSEKSRR